MEDSSSLPSVTFWDTYYNILGAWHFCMGLPQRQASFAQVWWLFSFLKWALRKFPCRHLLHLPCLLMRVKWDRDSIMWVSFTWKILWVASTPAGQLYTAINLYCCIKFCSKGMKLWYSWSNKTVSNYLLNSYQDQQLGQQQQQNVWYWAFFSKMAFSFLWTCFYKPKKQAENSP